MKRLILLIALLLPLALAASTPGRAAPPDSYFDNKGRDDAISGGVRMIDSVSRALREVSSDVILVSNAIDAPRWLAGARVFADVRHERGSLVGIHTALDTNGYLGERLSDDELAQIDLVLLDIKAWDPDRHKHLTGKDVGPILEFARRLAAQRRPIWLRYVLVPDLTDDEGDINQIAAFAAELGNVQRVDVLPFHQMGRYKWEKLGIDYSLKHTQPPTAVLVRRVCEQFRAAGLKAH